MVSGLARITGVKAELERQATECVQRIDRAARLIAGLAGEKERWAARAEELSWKFSNLTGDALLTAAAVTYLGPFTGTYREATLEAWLTFVDEVGRSPAPARRGCLCAIGCVSRAPLQLPAAVRMPELQLLPDWLASGVLCRLPVRVRACTCVTVCFVVPPPTIHRSAWAAAGGPPPQRRLFSGRNADGPGGGARLAGKLPPQRQVQPAERSNADQVNRLAADDRSSGATCDVRRVASGCGAAAGRRRGGGEKGEYACCFSLVARLPCATHPIERVCVWFVLPVRRARHPPPSCTQGQAGRWIRHQFNAQAPLALTVKPTEDEKASGGGSWPRARRRAAAAPGDGPDTADKTVLRVLKHSQPDLRQRLEVAITMGHTVLVEGVGDTLDNWMEPIIMKQVRACGGACAQAAPVGGAL
jgi:hypothetical protein